MIIESLAFSQFRGFGFDLKFEDNLTCLIGPNGCGKSTVLHLLAALTGHKDAVELVQDERFGEVTVTVKLGHERHFSMMDQSGVVHRKTEPARRLTLRLTDSFDPVKITAFKFEIGEECTSFVVDHFLGNDRYVTARRDPGEMQRDLLEWLSYHGLDVRKQLHVTEGRGATLLVSDTGAQRNLLHIGMRLAPQAVPMLVEHPERSLHPNLARRICDFYTKSNQQVIYTTHSPEVLAGFTEGEDTYNLMFNNPGQGLKLKGPPAVQKRYIDLSDEKHLLK